MSIISQLLKEGLKKQAKFAASVAEEALPTVAKAADEVVTPVVEQTTKAMAKEPIKLKKPVAPPSLEAATPVPAPATQAPVDLLQQTGEVLPPVASKKMGVDELYNELKPARPFPEEAYAKGKADLIDTFGAKEVENMIKNDPKDYANMLHVYAGDTLGLKVGKGLPPLPSEVADTAIVKYDDAGNPIPVGQIKKKTAGNVVPEQEVQYSGEYLVGELDNSVFKFKSTRERQDVLSEIKSERKRTFNTLKKNKLMEAIDGDVVAVAQGDFRVKYKREVDPSSDKAIAAFADLANSLQKKYDTLKEKYKDTPPIKLFHGNDFGVDDIKNEGFSDPQKFYKTSHSELKIGGPSFTKDTGLGAQGGGFGGKNPENYLYTEMPYADYMFKRINMSSDKYAGKDINVIAQTITGSPDTVRPLSLPRAGLNETEDVFVEAEKLVTQGKGKVRLKSAADELTKPIREGGEGRLQTTVNRREKFSKDRGLLSDYMTIVSDTAESLKDRRKTAYLTYDLIRTISNDLLGAAESTSVGKGLGQTYQVDISRFADQIRSTKKIQSVIEVLDDMGAVQKASTLRTVRDKLIELSTVSGSKPDKVTIKALNETREAARKLAEGGFVSRR